MTVFELKLTAEPKEKIDIGKGKLRRWVNGAAEQQKRFVIIQKSLLKDGFKFVSEVDGVMRWEKRD